MALGILKGTRLEFVVVPIPNPVKRVVVSLVPRGKTKDGKITGHTWKRELIDQEGGYMVYFPRGHAIRLRNKAALAQYGLDRKPKIINIEGLNDPNSPLGKLLSAQDDATRAEAMLSMEEKVIRAATARTGRDILTQVEEIAA